MPRATTHVCSQCGLQSAQWHGQCPGCEAWNTLVEERLPAARGSARAARGARRGPGAGSGGQAALRLVPRPLSEVGAAPVKRMSTGIGELDRVLGGGLVPGSLVLLGGSPGIGKSTLTNMALGHLAAAGRRTLYVSGEESAAQIRLRAERLGEHALDVPVLAETDLDDVVEVLDASARFVGEATKAAGSVVLAAMEGSRPLLVEVQALVSQSELVPPRRVCNGIDRNRLALVLAVLARHAGVGVGTSDVFVNVVGGMRVDEPGADLAVALAVAGAARGRGIGDPAAAAPPACFGELGLTGELRPVAHGDRRVAEAARFGLDPVLAPEGAGPKARALGSLRDALRA